MHAHPKLVQIVVSILIITVCEWLRRIGEDV